LKFGHARKARGRQARQVAINVIAVFAIFLMAGRFILNFFGVSIGAIQVAGGLLIAHTAWEMVTMTQPQVSVKEPSNQQRDITLIPMAVPIISGPGAIGMVMGLIAKDPQPINYIGSLLGIVAIGLLVYVCLAFGDSLIKRLGKSGIDAFTRILGFFILSVAIQLMTNGTFSLLRDLPLANLL
jgi:multiple antibiotic resistance protein